MVNIIIPTYKARATLPAALDSLVAQTKKLFIVTIVQDCDEEDYTDIIEEYRRRGLKLNLIKTPENLGPGGARQTGMDADSMCDYFMFLDADDLLMPRAVEVLYSEAKRQDADIILSDFFAEKPHQPGIYLKARETPVTWFHGKIYKSAYLKQNNIRCLPELRLNEDSYFNLVAVNCTQKKFYVGEMTYLWRANSNSLTRGEGLTGFFKKSWDQYVLSQVRALQKIKEIRGTLEIPTLAMTLINIYDQCMKALFLDYSIDVPCLKELRNEPMVMDNINTKQFWQVINERLHASTMFDKTLIFYSVRFCDWLTTYITGENQ